MKKEITNQLGLFDFIEPDYDELVDKKANDLLNMLNDGVKVKFEPEYTAQIGAYIILIATNKQKERLFNVIDIYGNMPENFSVNWRTASHVKQELLENIKN